MDHTTLNPAGEFATCYLPWVQILYYIYQVYIYILYVRIIPGGVFFSAGERRLKPLVSIIINNVPAVNMNRTYRNIYRYAYIGGDFSFYVGN